MVARNICRTHRFKNRAGKVDWEGYNAQCECGTDDHQHELIAEYDPDFDRISLSLYFKTWTANPYVYESGFIGYVKDVWRSFKFRVKCVFQGYNTLNYEFLFAGEEAVQDYIDALQDSLNHMKEAKAAAKENTNDIPSSLNPGD